MCELCNLPDNYFDSVECVYEHLAGTHPVLWLRDSSRVSETGYISRSLISATGDVLAIWNGQSKGWRLRTYKQEARDECPDPRRQDFIPLDDEGRRFCEFLRLWNT